MKNEEKELLVMSEFFENAGDLEKRYKSLKKTIKNLKKFNEAQIRGQVAEA